MAELAKKLYIQNAAGAIEAAKLYSTTGETAGAYLPLNVDNINCYAALCTPADGNATKGRILKNGTTFAIKKLGEIPYGYTIFGSSGTFTVPANVQRVRVTVIGGGGGGVYAEHALGGNSGAAHSTTGNAGAASSALGVAAGGGGGARCGYYDDSPSTDYSFWTQYAYNGGGGSGGTLLNGAYYGGGGGENQQTGYDYGDYTNLWEKARGGNGYVAQTIVGVTPGVAHWITVGGGGSGLHRTRTGQWASYYGGQGAVQIEWGKGI